ncbi:MAG TPA: T9SS type A sorting domain-containing protein [Flavisolibacter sp.]|nr:T9SS type A sorting domain-containing protein [Flavisolibacter sp.]
MKHVYLSISRTLFMALAVLSFERLSAQNETSTLPGNCPAVTQDFTNGTGGFTSPSVYGNITFDSAFYYNTTRGIWTELGSDLPGRQVPPAPNRVVTIVSPPVASTSQLPGIFEVGFYYIVPSATLDRFNVSLVRLTTTSSPGGDVTFQEVVARSGFRAFSEFSASGPAAYIDPLNPLTHFGDSGVVCLRLIDEDITTGPNITYRVEFTYVIPEPRFSDFDDFAVGTIAPGPLPVNFMGIVANRVDNSQAVNVKWDVADEIDVKEYQLEKSTNGATFNSVGSINAQGRSVYSLTDPAAKGNVIYYRVKSVDLNGATKYSGIVKLVNNNSFSNGIKTYPSPARSQLTLQHSQLGSNARLSISTADGRIIRVVTPARGVSNTMIDVSGLASGMYVLRLDNGNGKIETTTFVKQ